MAVWINVIIDRGFYKIIGDTLASLLVNYRVCHSAVHRGAALTSQQEINGSGAFVRVLQMIDIRLKVDWVIIGHRAAD